MKRKIFCILILTLFITSSSIVIADWDEGDGHKMHHPQLPDLDTTGTAVCMKGENVQYPTLADDFLCTESGPITGIHIWSSFCDDWLPSGGVDSLEFLISIRADAGSKPGPKLWQKIFLAGEYSVRFFHDGWQCWQCPWTSYFKSNDHRRTYQYNFLMEENEAFNQVSGTVYWLEVYHLHKGADYAFGWKTTSLNLRWGSNAQKQDTQNNWMGLKYHSSHEDGGEDLDLAFVITGGTGEAMELTSSAFEYGEMIPENYATSDPIGGEWGVSPPLTISNVPNNAESLVLIMDDPDAADWVHWIVYDIPPDTAILSENAGASGGILLPGDAEHGMTDCGIDFYCGPYPPIDDPPHRYFFTLFALDTMLNLPAGIDRNQLETAMAGHIIETAELMGTYSREEQPSVNVTITTPRDGLYFGGILFLGIPRIIPVPISVVLGRLLVVADVVGTGVDHVDFTAVSLVGGSNAFTDNSPPYEWDWNDSPGGYSITAVARDSSNNELGTDMVLVLKLF